MARPRLISGLALAGCLVLAACDGSASSGPTPSTGTPSIGPSTPPAASTSAPSTPATASGGPVSPAPSSTAALPSTAPPPASPGATPAPSSLPRPVPTPSVLLSAVTPSTTASDAQGARSQPLPACTAAARQTRHPGTLTVGRPAGVAAPFFSGGATGFDVAVVLALAPRLGIAADHVVFVPVEAAQAVAGTAAGVDLSAGTFVIPDDAADAPARYSTGYLAVGWSVLTSGSAGVGTLTGLRATTVGVVDGADGGSGSARAALLQNGVPSAAVQGFADADTAAEALSAGRVHAVVLDTVTAATAEAQHPGLTNAGRLPAGQGQADQLGLVLPARSPLADCVSTAVDTLRAEGTLDTLADSALGARARTTLR